MGSMKAWQRGLAHALAIVALTMAGVTHSPAAALASELDEVCGNDAFTMQKKTYCDAARKAKKAAEADGKLWKLWAGVATVCTTACVMSASVLGIASNQYVCMGTNLAVGVTDALVTKQYMSAMMSIGSAGASYMINDKLNSGEKSKEAADKTTDAAQAADPNAQPVQKDWGSCLTAAIATLQSFTKHQNEKSQEDSYRENLASARKLDSDLAMQFANTRPNELSNSPSGSTPGGAPQNPSGSGQSLSGSSSEEAGTCSPSQVNFQCAVAADSTLPKFVSDPKFADEFKKTAGMPLQDFVNSPGGTPAKAIGGGVSNALGNRSTGIIATLGQIEQNFGDVPGTAYASGGGGAGAGRRSGGDGGDLNQMLAGFMDKLMPKSGEEGKATGVSAVAFANRTRAPASLSEDPSLNIFDRVSYRYLVVSNKLFTKEQPQ